MRPIVDVAPVRDKPKLLDLVRDVIRRKNYSIRTELLSVMMIQPSLLAPWTKQRWHIDKLAKPTKQIDCRGSYASDIRITLAGKELTNHGFFIATNCPECR
jgi:hypothetical protein